MIPACFGCRIYIYSQQTGFDRSIRTTKDISFREVYRTSVWMPVYSLLIRGNKGAITDWYSLKGEERMHRCGHND